MPRWWALNFRCCSKYHAMTRRLNLSLALVALALMLLANSPYCVLAQTSAAPKAKGRLYVFRMVRSYGAHLDDYVTINGASIQKIKPGNGIYCDLPPGDYTVGLAQRKAQPIKVSVLPGQRQYVCVMLHHRGATPRSGALAADQSFDIRLLDPAYGAERAAQYHLVPASCQP